MHHTTETIGFLANPEAPQGLIDAHGGFQLDSAISFVSGKYESDSTELGFPTSGGSGASLDSACVGPNFQFTAVPELSAFVFLLGGLLTIGCAVLRGRWKVPIAKSVPCT